ncbi:AzlC family ABC transporter permease [Brevibacillus fluminis]|uniref:AzlC family ABC transporter permease n=1 Tax=Brevibacillus fluminis TaxID=511487 RepID=UPI003F8B136D
MAHGASSVEAVDSRENKGGGQELSQGRLFWRGMQQMMPIAAAGVLDGLVFGILARHAGLSLFETMLLTLLVNAGSSQFAAVGLISQGIVGWPLLVSTLLINARQLLYGLSLGPAFRNLPVWKLSIMAGQVNDETYALKSTYLAQGGKPSMAYFMGAGFGDYAIWHSCVFAGAMLGTAFTGTEQYGLDFAFIATFLGFLALNLTSSFTIKTAVVAAGAACLGYWMFGLTSSVVMGTVAAMLMGVFSRER